MKKFLKKIIYSTIFPQKLVLMFHSISSTNHSPFSLSERNFFELVESIDEASTIYKVSSCDKKSFFALTFDDGYEDIYNIVYPILSKKQIPFTIFVNISLLDTPGYLSREMLKELSLDPLITIGSHSFNHVHLPALSSEEQEKNLLLSQQELESITNKKVDLIAYPYGQNTKITRKISKKYYKFGFTAGGRFHNFIFLLFRKYSINRFNVFDETIIETIDIIKKMQKGKK